MYLYYTKVNKLTTALYCAILGCFRSTVHADRLANDDDS